MSVVVAFLIHDGNEYQWKEFGHVLGEEETFLHHAGVRSQSTFRQYLPRQILRNHLGPRTNSKLLFRYFPRTPNPSGR